MASRVHDSNVLDSVGLSKNLLSGKLPRIGVFALVVLLTGQFLEVQGLLLPWFKELN